MNRHDQPATPAAASTGDDEASAPTVGRVLVLRSLVGVAGLTFAVLLALVLASWRPLFRADEAVIAGFNSVVGERGWLVTGLGFVTDLGGTEAAWVLLPLVVVWLLLRRLPLLAAYVAAAGLGAAVLSNGIKALVDRVRPVVDEPVAQAHDPSFPSGHALGSTVTYGVLLLVFLPVIPRRFRGWAVGAVAALVLAVGLTRVALGVHFPSDVLGGWSLGLVWLAVTASAFRHVQPRQEEHGAVVVHGLEEEARPSLQPAPVGDRVLPHGARSGAFLAAVAVLIWGALTGVGLLVTGPFASVVGPLDHAVNASLVEHRTDPLNEVAVTVGMLGGTRGIIMATVAAVAIAVAVTRRRRPAVFLLLLPVVETLIFMATATVVDRDRPSVTQLSETLPPTASFPSGHVAAAVVTYGGIALLTRSWGGRLTGHLAVGAAVLVVLLVASSRLYRGVHHPTDVLGSLLYAGTWLAVCWAVIRPGHSPDEAGNAASSNSPAQNSVGRNRE